MFDFDDLPKFIFQPMLKLVLALLRVLWFLAWDLWVEWIFWSIGWVVLKTLTWGRYPTDDLFRYEKNVSFWAHFFICAVGALTLGSAVYGLMQLL